MEDLLNELANYRKGDKVEVGIDRGGKNINVEVTLQELE